MSSDAGMASRALAKAIAGWRWLPIVVRAIVVGLLILQIGGAVPGVLLVACLKLTPAIPWFLPATALWLWCFWRYASGRGGPAATARIRQTALRGRSLSGRIWFWSLLAGAPAMMSVMGLIFVTSKFGNLPAKAFAPPFEISIFPWWTILSIFVAIAATAGVVEEAAFRGYMLSAIERRHGWSVGIPIVGLVFYVAHLSHAYATLAFLPFFLVYSAFHGLMVYLTRSILPSVVLHAIADFIVVPMQFGVLPGPGDSKFVTHGGLSLVFAIASLPALWRLATVAREEASRDRPDAER
ncbi:MAG: type II CAAX endopeptidase family protein [Thermoanaerobaculia bacterium]